MKPTHNQLGFTLLELAVTLSIFILVLISIPLSFKDFYQSYQKQQTIEQIEAFFNLARTKALVKSNNSNISLRIDDLNKKISLYFGDTYQEANVLETYSYPAAVSITGLVTITFLAGNGYTNSNQTLSLFWTNQPFGEIKINRLGIINSLL